MDAGRYRENIKRIRSFNHAKTAALALEIKAVYRVTVSPPNGLKEKSNKYNKSL